MQHIKEALHDRLNKPMSRRQFLEFAGGLLLAILGINNLLAYITGGGNKTIVITNGATESKSGVGSDFGSRKFGA